MATELIMPSVNTQPGYGFYDRPQHHRSQSYQIPQRGVNYTGVSSLSSSNSSGNSPTSPKAYHTRQARPLFMPAALRPNESTGDSGKAFEEDEDELDVDMFPDVTALPTKQHWKPDPASTVCDDPTCKRTFGYFTRRHHCRRCGNIFCDTHSSNAVILDQDANYNPRGSPSRACNHCHTEYQSWRSRNSSRNSSSASSEIAGASASGPKACNSIAASANALASLDLAKASVAASVPRDWNWSTF
ncbi:unnamed protein product [Parascedosporium putredinis]|uniref:FYVE-type domain-containing protein n=1 Tax=Parascedosporium putredinis TaxID=1442378 RepID=A0A9P1MEX6_9PEZI|nr:unnamed protein product [Parascedosporium putredinis]CAI8003819.1 unnamed protein product [Parascedosporium putredinis]